MFNIIPCFYACCLSCIAFVSVSWYYNSTTSGYCPATPSCFVCYVYLNNCGWKDHIEEHIHVRGDDEILFGI
jgi:hypothetical protein